MATTANAMVQLETSQTPVALQAMSTADGQTYYVSGAAEFSVWQTKEASILPDGVLTGINLITPAASGTDDAVDVAAFTFRSKGITYSVAAQTDVALTRPGAGENNTNIITVSSTGTVTVIAGADSSGGGLVSTYGAAGGPAFVPVNSVLLGWVALDSSVSAPVVASEILQNPGTYMEMAESVSGVWHPVGLGISVESSAPNRVDAHYQLNTALSPIHTGSTYREVWISGYTPNFETLPSAKDFTRGMAEGSVTVNEYYDGALQAAESRTFGTSGFVYAGGDGHTDVICRNSGNRVTAKYYVDKYQDAYYVCQGLMTHTSSDAVASTVEHTVTINPRQPGVNKRS
jgi:hypothetical protein